jgi:hypothetical protein
MLGEARGRGIRQRWLPRGVQHGLATQASSDTDIGVVANAQLRLDSASVGGILA